MAQRLKSWTLWLVNTHVTYPIPLRATFTSQANQNDHLPTSSAKPATSTSSIRLLPLEVHCEILKYLDWKDLSNASLLNGMWYRATHSKQLWYAMAKDLELTCGIGRPEEPVGDYTVAELRRWITQRLRTQEAWSTASVSTTFKERRINHPDVHFAKLLPGGRWLFVNEDDGKLFCYDLESTELEKRLLIDPGLGDNASMPDRLYHFDFWIDRSKNKLTLRIALWNAASKMEVTRTCIYQVHLTGHGETAVLVAKPLSVVRDYINVKKWAVGLSEKYLVDCRIVNSRNRRLSLVPYGVDDPESKRISVPYPTSRACELYITPSDHIIVVGFDYIDIYAIRQIEEHEDSLEEIQHEISPLHHIVCDGASIRTSTPFIFQGYSWLIYGHQNQIHLSRIPYGEEDDCNTITLGEYALGNRDRSIPFFGPTSTIVVHPDYSADAVTYSWDAEMNVTTFLTRPISIPVIETNFRRVEPAGLEEGIGRIVFRSRRDKECVVLDIL